VETPRVTPIRATLHLACRSRRPSVIYVPVPARQLFASDVSRVVPDFTSFPFLQVDELTS